MPRKRHDQTTAEEWNDFLEAFEALHILGGPFPRLNDFADAHATLLDGCGSGGGHHPHFLPWVRHLLHRFERALQETRRTVFVPYWAWDLDPAIPAALDQPELLDRWRVARQFRFHEMPPRELVDTVRVTKRFDVFQRLLEVALHGGVVAAVSGGGSYAHHGGLAATRDPLFWCHLANIDRLWVEFQARCPQEVPRNVRELMGPSPLFGVPIQAVLAVPALGYAYA
jgi:Common central domain of tyrosinase